MILPRTLVLITARGGSKGVPGKNVARVGGIPLVGRSARVGRGALGACAPGSRVVCSTDDTAIADAARAWGADIPFLRPADLASDGATSIDVVLHALDVLGNVFETVVLLQPTSPFTTVEDVTDAMVLSARHGAAVVSVCQAEHPVEWLQTLDQENRLSAVIQTAPRPSRRQLTAPIVRPNGAVYVAPVSQLTAQRSFFGPSTVGYVMPPERSLDIDTPFDLEMARAVCAERSKGASSVFGRKIGANEPSFVIAAIQPAGDESLASATAVADAACDAGANGLTVLGAETTQDTILCRDPEAHNAFLAHCHRRNLLYVEACQAFGAGLDVERRVGARLLRVDDVTHCTTADLLTLAATPLLLLVDRADMPQTAAAVDVLGASGSHDVVLVAGPGGAPDHMASMVAMREAFGAPVGYADTTAGSAAMLAAVALGAAVVVMPLRVDSKRPDIAGAMTPGQFGETVRTIRALEFELGRGRAQIAVPL